MKAALGLQEYTIFSVTNLHVQGRRRIRKLLAFVKQNKTIL